MSKCVRTECTTSKEILKFSGCTAVGVIVSDAGIEAVDGKKVVPGGTVVAGGAKSVLLNPEEPVVKKNTAEAEGVLLTDVDVTYGPASGSMVIHGFINAGKLPEEPSADAVKALRLIMFLG